MVPVTAEGKSASSKTINGAFLFWLASVSPTYTGTHPPSSNDIFFSVPEQFLARSLPTLVDPVNETFRMSGFVVSSSPTA